MLGEKASITSSKKGIFLFELLTGIFLFSLSLSIVWTGFFHALKNCNIALTLYKGVVIASKYLESDRNDDCLHELLQDYSIKEESKRVYLQTKEFFFDMRLVTLRPLNISDLQENDLQKIVLWEYRGKN